MTRTEYIINYVNDESGKLLHRQYYGQYVNDWVKEQVMRIIGKDRILKSNDPDFNNIPLNEWDAVLSTCPQWIDRLMRENGDYPTQGGMVCIVKEAALQIVENEHNLEV